MSKRLFNKKDKSTSLDKAIVFNERYISSDIEGYVRLRDNILFINSSGDKKVIQVESSVAHEGKTTLICNLAVSLGFTEKKVVLVDLDFRKPRVHYPFGLSIENGIAEYMLGTIDKEQLIKRTSYKNVDIITRGGKIYNSSLVLVSEKFRNLIAELRKEYDYILLDCAPILQVSDYINILKVADGVLLAVAYGTTTKHQLSDAVKELKNNNANLIGTVFTMYDKKKESYYGKGYYSHYYNYLEEKDSTSTVDDLSSVELKKEEESK